MFNRFTFMICQISYNIHSKIFLFFYLQVTPLQWGRYVSSDYGIRGMGVCADPGSFRWCKALSRSRSFATTLTSYLIKLLLFYTIRIAAHSIPGKSIIDSKEINQMLEFCSPLLESWRFVSLCFNDIQISQQRETMRRCACAWF